MATLEENIMQTISDFDDIKAAIEEQGVEVEDGTDTKEYGNKIRSIAGGAAEQTYNPTSEKAQSGLAVAEAIAGIHITYLESLDKENYLNLFDLESGTYILYGYFLVYPNATKRYTFSKRVLVSVSKGSISTCLQVFYPPYNTIQYLNIYPPNEEAGTDYTFERKDAELYYMESVENKVTEITDDVTDEQYPTALAVHKAKAETANAIKGTANGEIIRVDDVSPITHSVKAKVKGKNLWDMSKITSTNNVTNNGDGSLTIAPNTYYGTTSKRLYEVCPRLKVGDVVTFSMLSDGVQYIYLSIYGTTVWNGDTITVTEDILNSVIAVYGVADTDAGYGNSHTISYIQLELGDTATEYEPYIDPTAVTVTRCGKNLLDITKAELMIVGASGSERYGVVFDKTGTYTFSCVAPSGIAVKVVTDGEYGDYVTLLNNVSYTFTLAENQYLILYQGSEGVLFNHNLTNAQIEEGDTATEYEPYAEIKTYTPEADGTINGITSLAPTMTLLTDTKGAMLDVEYNQDINAAFKGINAILETLLNGGE